MFIDGNLQSTSGDIGLIAAGQVLQSADILTTSGDVFIDATGNVTMTQPLTQTVAGGNILIDSRGTITLGLLQAARVSLNATNDILDGNDTRAVPDATSIVRANVRASELRMVAGGTIGTADAVTALPEQNLNAIDMEVGTVAAQSATGIYLQELAAGGDLVIGNVPATSITINVRDVEFRSTSSLVTETRSLNQLDDLETTNNGPIKVIVEAGTLTVTEGNDNDNVGVRANGTGDVLLRVYGAGSDIITTDDLGAGGEARILSGTGNITLRAADEISLTAQVATGGAGTIYMVSGGNTDINRQVTTVDGDMLLRAGADMFIDGNLQSTGGDIGLIAAGQVLQSADILTTGGNVFIDATGNVTMTQTATQTVAGGNILIDSRGTITLGLLQAVRVSLNATNDILDGNDTRGVPDAASIIRANVRASGLRMIAGGTIGTADTVTALPEQNLNAIDTEVDTVAARSATGIYLQELAAGGDLVIGNVPLTSITVDVRDVEFRSTTSLVTETRSLSELDDLETTNNGPIKVMVEAGTLTVTEGNDNDNVGILANGTGDVLLRVYTAGSDIVTTDDLGASGEARIRSGTGNITLRAADEISLTAQVATGGTGTIYMVSGGNTDINRQVTTASGDILLSSGADISVDGNLQSTAGNIGLIAAGQVLQSADILTTSGDVFVDATGNVTMTLPATRTVAGGNILIDSRGTITLGLLQAVRVSLNASQDILDGNDTRAVPDASSIIRANVRASQLRMVAGGTIGTADTVTSLAEQNLSAIDTEVGTVAARSATGIYLQELAAGGDLIVGNVPATTVTVNVQDVEFRSTTSLVNPGPRTLAELNDLETTNNGPIKVIVDAGTLTITEGNDNDNVGVSANGTGNVLLRVYGAGSDIITTDDLGTNGEARILSGTGNITLRAADEISLTAQVATGGAGTIYMVSGGNMDINRQVTSVNGDMLLQSSASIFIDGNLQSTSGDIGLIATGQVLQSADILTTSGNVFIDAGGNVTMSQNVTKTVAGGNILIDSRGTITLGLLQAVRVSLNATNDILDGNDTRAVPDATSIVRANVRASELRMVAGGRIGAADAVTALVEQNLSAIDTEVGTVAARSATGIYLQELAIGGGLVIGNVATTNVTVNVQDVEFRSTTSAIDPGTRTLAELNDLETTNNGPIKVIVENGTLTVTEGNDDDNVGVSANGTGDVLLRAYGAGSDVITTDDLGANGEARILSGTGNITLRAADEISLTAQVTTGGAGTIYMVSGGNLDINRQVTSVNGDMLLQSSASIFIDGNLQSTGGDIGLIAAGQVLQSANIDTTNGNVFVDAVGNVTMTLPATFTKAGGNILIDSRGTITLGLLDAVRVSLNATNDILDGNDTRAVPDSSSTVRANVRATELRMVAGGTIGTADGVTSVAQQNLNAIDMEVGTVAAQSATGIYLQELVAGGNLVIGNVAATSFTVNVLDVEFRSTTSLVDPGPRTLGELNDLETTNNGPIKVLVDAGTLTVTEGNDNDNVGVRANGSGDVMLRANGVGSDIIATDDLGAGGEARILSGTGNITLRAVDEIRLTAQVTTGGTGTIYMLSGGNLDINRQVTSVSGDILLRSTADISIDSNVQSTSGDIGLIAAGSVSQSADIITNGGVFIDAGGDVNMSALTKIDAGANLTIDSGASITLGLLDATRVSLRAAQNIVDGNDVRNIDPAPNTLRTNVRAVELSMLAGGKIGDVDGVTTAPEKNINAIDLEVGTVAARAVSGIYLQELTAGGALIVGNVVTADVTVDVRDVEFRSTTSPVGFNQTLVDVDALGNEVELTSLDDLETIAINSTTPSNGPIRVVVDGGTLTVTEGNDNDNVGVKANGTGDIYLKAIGASSDVIVTDDLGTNGEARILSDAGKIVISADDDISLTAQVQTGGAGTIDMVAKNLTPTDAVGGIDINRQVTSESGDITLVSARDIFVDGGIRSTSAGDITATAENDIVVNATVQTTGAGTITLVARDRVADTVESTGRQNGIYINGRVEAEAGTVRMVAGVGGVFPLPRESNILLNSTIHNSGTIELIAAGHIEEDHANTVRVEGTSLAITADTYAHLNDVRVRNLNASVETVGALQSWQLVNEQASAAGQAFFQRFNGLDGGSTFDPNRVLTGGTATAGITQDPTARYNFSAFYRDEYALFIRNTGDLIINNITSGNSGTGAKPHVYVETIDPSPTSTDSLIDDCGGYD